MNTILFEDHEADNFRPLVLTRPGRDIAVFDCLWGLVAESQGLTRDEMDCAGTAQIKQDTM